MFSPEFLNQICQRAYIRTPRDSWNFDHARDGTRRPRQINPTRAPPAPKPRMQRPSFRLIPELLWPIHASRDGPFKPEHCRY
jgi:hypothetical protein